MGAGENENMAKPNALVRTIALERQQILASERLDLWAGRRCAWRGRTLDRRRTWRRWVTPVCSGHRRPRTLAGHQRTWRRSHQLARMAPHRRTLAANERRWGSGIFGRFRGSVVERRQLTWARGRHIADRSLRQDPAQPQEKRHH